MVGKMAMVRRLIAITAVVLICVGDPATDAAAQEKSSQESLTLFSDAANFQNNGAYDLALEEWKKFLGKYPKDPLVPKARHYQGVCQLQLKQYEAAAGSFEQVVKSAPKFELIEDAYLNWAWSQYSAAQTGKKELFVKAAATFGELLTKHPKTKYADQALFFRAESLYMSGKVKESLAPYRQLVKDHAESKLLCDALYALGVSLEELKEFAEAGEAYDQFLSKCKQDPLTNEVRMRKAETLAQTDQLEAAVRLFQEVSDAAGFASADHAAYRRAACLSNLNEFSAAADGYAQLIAKFPATKYKEPATMAAARCYYRADNAAEAKKWLQQVLDKKTKDGPEAAHWLCRIQLREGQHAAAAKLAEQTIAAAEESEYLVHLKLDQADALYEQGDAGRRQALALFLKAAADHAGHALAPQAAYNAAFAAMELKDYQQALDLSAQFTEKYAEDRLAPDARYVRAESLLQLGRPAEAEKDLRELAELKEHTESANWVVRLGAALYLQKKYADADTYLTAQVARLKTPPHQAEANYLMGASRFYGDKFDEASTALQASLKHQADWRQADETMLFLGRCQFKLNQIDAAKKTLAQIFEKFPQTAIGDQAHYRLGEIHYAGSQWADAAKEYKAVSDNWPDSLFAPFSLYGSGWSHLRLSEFPAAVAALTTLLEKHGDHQLAAEGQFARAMCQRQLGKFKESIADVDAFLKTEPKGNSLSDALYEKGLAQVGLKDWKAASVTLAGLVESQPEYAHLDKVLYELAWTYKSQGDAAQAATQFAALASKYGDSPLAAEANFHVGEQRYEAKKYVEAAAAYAAAKKSTQAELKEKATYKLGWTHFQQEAFKQALTEFGEQLRQFPKGGLAGDALFMKGECSFKLEDYETAFTAFSAAAKTESKDKRIAMLTLLHGGQAAAQLKDWESSLTLLDQAVTKYKDSNDFAEAVYERGRAHQQLKDAAKAKADFELAADKSRNEVGARARFMLGEIYFGEKSFTAAIRQFQRVMFGYGATRATPETKVWQAKAGFEAARCAEVQIQDAATAGDRAQLIQDAKKFYTYVVQTHPKDDLAAAAKKRLADLAKL
ncbi:MAG: tetratricopeptide repeat protein [Pirellulaceae bacterium]|nr:tetratricopeptide repeat protein [Pirellulaceae bacterium]